MYVLTYMHPSHAGQANLQNKVDTLQNRVINLESKIYTFQNKTEVSTGKHHHEMVELLQNISYSLDSKTFNYLSFVPTPSHPSVFHL